VEAWTLEFANLRWPEGKSCEAKYCCTPCGALIGQRHKISMLEHGPWHPTAPRNGRTAGFHLSSTYNLVERFSWADAAEMYEQARKTPT
jgi:hypothetical protein